MLPSNLSLVGLVKEAAEAESAPPVAPGSSAPEAEESQGKRKRAPRLKPEVSRKDAKPRSLWVSDSTWNRLRLASFKKGTNCSALAEEILAKALPDLVLQERSA